MAIYEQSSVKLNIELTDYYNIEFALKKLSFNIY